MSLAWLRDALERGGDGEAVVEGQRRVTYRELLAGTDAVRETLRGAGVRRGEVLAFVGDYSLAGITRFLAAVLEGLVAVPVATQTESEGEALIDAAPVDWWYPADAPLDSPPRRRSATRSDHPLLAELRERGRPGIIIMTSGSTGAPKVILHDAEGLLGKFAHPRRSYRVIVFLLPDHMGGVNTLFGTLSAGGTVIIPPSRDPHAVCATVSVARATLLPVTPSFLNLLLLSGAPEAHDLSSLRVVSYGTEVIPERTLEAAVRAFPGVRFLQLYGSSELGIFRGRSRANDSPFVRLEGAEFRIHEGRLWVRGADSMLGYLSGQPAGFDSGGWYDTGDLVEVDGEYVRFLGRASQLINVGGLKVFPAEVEAAIAALDGVEDCSVWGAPHPLTGQVVAARVQLSSGESARAFKRRMREALRGRLEPSKIPVSVELAESVVGSRLKKIRRPLD